MNSTYRTGKSSPSSGILLVAVLLVLSASIPAVAQEPRQPQPGVDYVPGEILVKFNPDVGLINAQDVLSVQGLQVTDVIQPIDVIEVAVEPGSEIEAIEVLRDDPNVSFAELNYLLYADETIPDDDSYSLQYGLPKIKTPFAWDITTGSAEVVIAVVDTGIALSHLDLNCGSKLTPGYDFYNHDPDPDDDNGHGSHVAGIAAACSNNEIGVAGTAWAARLMPVKTLSGTGSGSQSVVAEGVIYAVDHGAQIVNLSMGSSTLTSALQEACQYAYDRGVLVVASAGNCASGGSKCTGINPIMYPGAFPTTLAVAATDSNDQWANFSEHHPYVDVAAPGVSIYSTLRYNSYGYKSGTSMSAPFVSGLAALIWGIKPDLTYQQVWSIIESSAEDLGTPGKDDYFGYGRIDAWRALESMNEIRIQAPHTDFIVSDDKGPYPVFRTIQFTTTSTTALNWTAQITPTVSWLNVTPASGTVAADAPGRFTISASKPGSYGEYSTQILITAIAPSGAIIGPDSTGASIRYVHELKYEFPIPVLWKNPN